VVYFLDQQLLAIERFHALPFDSYAEDVGNAL
jgi:hypothetical protein